jgi:hypothetical protein
MRYFAKIMSLFLGMSLVSLFVTSQVLAFPPLPASFYGSVKVNGANVSDGTLIRATINGKVYAETKTLTYQGNSVYSLDVPGDDTDSTAVDGGREGDKITFTVGAAQAGQTGTWKSGTNLKLDLSVSNTGSQETPVPTEPQLDLSNPQPVATSTPEITQAIEIPPENSPTATAGKRADPTKSNQANPIAPAKPLSLGTEQPSRNSTTTIAIIGIILVILILGAAVWLVFVRRRRE